MKDILKGIRHGTGFALALVVIASVTVLFAQSMSVFKVGEMVSANSINNNFLIAAPQGQVAGFMLTACPNGWIAADGVPNGTPRTSSETRPVNIALIFCMRKDA